MERHTIINMMGGKTGQHLRRQLVCIIRAADLIENRGEAFDQYCGFLQQWNRKDSYEESQVSVESFSSVSYQFSMGLTT